MLIRRRRRGEPRSSEITDEALYLRRDVLRGAALGALAGAGVLASCGPPEEARARGQTASELRALEGVRNSDLSTNETWTDYKDATSYNNFYEFGTDKEDPERYAGSLVTDPWSIRVEGEVAKPGALALEDVLSLHPLEERVYRLRCVEAWSMVIPWIGFPLRALLEHLEPTPRAKFVEFRTLHDPKQMRGQRVAVLDWPYREGLRLDEAMHPLAILVVGMYGRVLPNQNGAPLRLVVPWKYGFKSIKSIVGIRLTERQPATSWNVAGPREYGFYSNVNPAVDHPRWSQKTERRIGEFRRRPTLPFNGYADEVSGLYSGMDLEVNF